MRASHFSQDVQDFLRLLAKHSVKYVIVGGEAVIYYGYARLTGDVDFFFETSQENAENLYKALNEFWDHNIPGIEKVGELLETGVIIQFGIQPNRIDLINKIDGIQFEEAWLNKETTSIKVNNKRLVLYFIGLDQLIKNKETAKRYKDLEDIKYLKKAKNKQ